MSASWSRTDPTRTPFPYLVGSLTNPSVFFRELRRPQDALGAAEEADAIRRELAKMSPSHVPAPDLVSPQEQVSVPNNVGRRSPPEVESPERARTEHGLAVPRGDGPR